MRLRTKPWSRLGTRSSRLKILPSNDSGYLIRVDSDGDGDLLEEPQQALDQDSPITVGIERHWASDTHELQYRLAYKVWTDKTDRVRESLIWSPHYRAEGPFRYKNCAVLLTVLDMDGKQCLRCYRLSPRYDNRH